MISYGSLDKGGYLGPSIIVGTPGDEASTDFDGGLFVSGG